MSIDHRDRLAHEDHRNEASQRLRDATRLIEAHEERDRYKDALEAICDEERTAYSPQAMWAVAHAALHPEDS